MCFAAIEIFSREGVNKQPAAVPFLLFPAPIPDLVDLGLGEVQGSLPRHLTAPGTWHVSQTKVNLVWELYQEKTPCVPLLPATGDQEESSSTFSLHLPQTEFTSLGKVWGGYFPSWSLGGLKGEKCTVVCSSGKKSRTGEMFLLIEWRKNFSSRRVTFLQLET